MTIGAAEAIFTATSTMIRGTATSALSALARGNLLDGRITTSRRHPGRQMFCRLPFPTCAPSPCLSLARRGIITGLVLALCWLCRDASPWGTCASSFDPRLPWAWHPDKSEVRYCAFWSACCGQRQRATFEGGYSASSANTARPVPRRTFATLLFRFAFWFSSWAT